VSIVDLDKVTLVGHRDNKDEVLAGLQELGCLHLIPLTPRGEAKTDSGPSKDAREALRFLAGAPEQRRQVSNPRRFDAGEVERQALDLQKRIFKLRNRRDFISVRIDNLEAWGDFEFPSLAQLDGNHFWFYQVPHHEMKVVENSGLRWEVVKRDDRFFYVIVVAVDEPPGMPVPRLHMGGVSRPRLLEQLESVEIALEDAEAERVSLSRWVTLFARALDGLEDRSARAQAAAQTAESDPVYALQAWAPRDRIADLQVFAAQHTLAVEAVKPAPDEEPPTLFHNAAPLRAGEDLVAFYMTPSYWLWDPSSVVFLSFAIFFGMIVADAGYAGLLAVIVLVYRKRLGASGAGRRWRVMILALAGATAIYGIMAGSYFGVTPPPDSLLGRLHILDLGNFTVMMALSVIIGATHVAYASVRNGLRFHRWQQRAPSFGWAVAVIGGLATWGGMQLDQQALFDLGLLLMGVGLLLVLAFTGYGEKPLMRLVKGITALSSVSGAFGDVLSYLRLFALGLASASLASAFNDMAGDVRAALPGIGVLFGLLILLLGHALNFLLSVASGFIHGLRLNVIEFFKWGVQEEGNPYRPFARKESL
jgi:V/A-type H+-transporting ATPase subunit I